MQETLRIVVFEVGKPPEERIVEHDLKIMQEIVGGYIEAVGLPNSYVLICNEEGLLLGLPENVRHWLNYPIAGNFFIVKYKGERFVSIPEDEIENVKKGIFETKARS